jgi:hypothetical protein
MPSASRLRRLDSIVGPFADLLLTADLPELPDERRADVVEFVQRRANGVPSFTRFGLTVIALLYHCVMFFPGGRRIARALASKPIPLLGEYPRLVRSLGFAYVWDRWPDTSPTGRAS